MRTTSIYKHDANAGQRYYNDGLVSDCSGSTATPQLLKLASLEFGGSVSTRSVNGKPVIDLTHIPNDDEYFSGRKTQKYIVTVHDTASRNSSDSSARYQHSRVSSKHQSPSMASSSGGTTRGSSKTHPDAHLLIDSSRAKFHRNGTSATKKKTKAVRNNDLQDVARDEPRKKNEFQTVHHNGANIIHAADARIAKFVQVQAEAKPEALSETVDCQPKMVQTLSKPPRPTGVRKKTLLGSLFQCVNPPVPGDDEVPIKSRSQLLALKAFRSDEDALDRVFNTVERFSCRDEADFRNELRQFGDADDIRQRLPPGFFDGSSRNSIISGTAAGLGRAHEKNAKNTNEKDALDTVFDGVERFACRDDANTSRYSQYDTYEEESDAIDRVFEGVERFACHDDHNYGAATLQNRALRTPHWKSRHDPPARKAQIGSSQLERNDMLEKFGRNFERALCTNQAAHIGHEGDVLDGVFEQLERTACRDEGFHESEGGYYDTSVYDLDMQNSLVESKDCGSKEWFDFPRNNSMRRPSCGNGQPSQNRRNTTPPGKDMLDYVFENVEQGVCRSDEHLSNRARSRRSNDRISDSRRY